WAWVCGTTESRVTVDLLIAVSGLRSWAWAWAWAWVCVGVHTTAVARSTTTRERRRPAANGLIRSDKIFALDESIGSERAGQRTPSFNWTTAGGFIVTSTNAQNFVCLDTKAPPRVR